jgi:MFS family permease
VYAVSVLLQAIGIGAAGVMPNVWAALPCFVLSGIGNGTAVVCNSLLVQRGASDDIRGRVFTVIMSVNYAVYGAGVLLAGPLTDSFGPRWVYVSVGGLLLFAALIAYVLGREQILEPRPEVEAA